MINNEFPSYLDDVDKLTMKQGTLLKQRLSEQTEQEEMLSKIEKRIGGDLECPQYHSDKMQRNRGFNLHLKANGNIVQAEKFKNS